MRQEIPCKACRIGRRWRGGSARWRASFPFGVLSLVGGLLGWLLVMKKAVLQCNACGAVVAAS